MLDVCKSDAIPPTGCGYISFPESRKGEFIATKIRYFPFSLEDDEYVPASGPFFSCDADALRKEAANRQRDGATKAAKELRQQANYFEDLRQNADEKTILRWDFEGDDWEKFQIIAWLANEDDKIFEAICQRTMKYCKYLSEQATAGRTKAAHKLALVAILATRVIGEIAKSNPSALWEVSQQEVAWPVLKSGNQKFSTDERKLLKKSQPSHRI